MSLGNFTIILFQQHFPMPMINIGNRSASENVKIYIKDFIEVESMTCL